LSRRLKKPREISKKRLSEISEISELSVPKRKPRELARQFPGVLPYFKDLDRFRCFSNICLGTPGETRHGSSVVKQLLYLGEYNIEYS